MRRIGRWVATRRHRPRRPGPGELLDDPPEITFGEHRVGGDDEHRRARPLVEPAADDVGGAEHARLPHEADGQAERLAVADELLDLPGEVAGDDERALDPRTREVAEKRRDHRPPADGEDRLRPALRDRPHPPALPRRHHDRVQLCEPERPD